MIKRMIIMLVFVGLLFGGIFGFQSFKAHMTQKYMAARGIPPQTVSTMTAKETAWQPQIEAVGSLVAVHGADIASEVSGIVSRIHFKSGDEVKAGDLLLELNADTDLARLQAIKAQANLARKIYQRNEKQLRDQLVSQATMDTDLGDLQSAEAQVAEQEALIAKKSIRAPFDGRLGIRAVNLGQYLNPGAKIVTLQALDPIYIDFYLPQKYTSQIAAGQKVSVKADAFPDEAFPGAITAINPKVDIGSRNIEIRARIDNPQHRLLPGMFATVDVLVDTPQQHITLPQTAITYNPYGDLVYVVENKGQGKDGHPRLVAQQKFVTVGATRGDQVAVLTGIQPGDVVVTAGQIKLRNGTPVLINNSIQPADDAAPQPKDE
jgi:membrane fusion protein, multidrug efflux system